MGSAVTLLHDSIILEIGEMATNKSELQPTQKSNNEQQKEQVVQPEWHKLVKSQGQQQLFIGSSYGPNSQVGYLSSQTNLLLVLANLNQITDETTLNFSDDNVAIE